MASKLIMNTGRDGFIDYIRNASELDAWNAISEAALVVTWFRTGSKQRAELDRTLDKAIAAFEQTFGPWAPF